MTWKLSKFDCHFSRYTSGEYEIVQGYEGGWQLNQGEYFVSSHASLRDATEYAEEHSRFN